MTIGLDLTSWVRGPHTGVGLSAFRCYQALNELSATDPVTPYKRDGRNKGSVPLRQLSPWTRVLGSPSLLWHSFDYSLPPLRRSKKILTVHDLWTLRDNPYQAKGFQQKQSKKLMRAIERADFFLTPSEVIRQELIQFNREFEKRTQVVPWAPLLSVDPSKSVDSDVSKYLAERRPFFLSVARLEVRKNLPLLCRAMKGQKLDLVVVGEATGYGADETLRALETLKESGTRVIHFAALDEASLLPLYRECFALVQPSLEEGFGMPVLEAMQLGRPVVLSDIPVFREIAAEAGIFFRLEGGQRELASALESLSRSEVYQKHSKASSSRASEFSWKKTAEKLSEVYKRLTSPILLP